MSKRRTPLSERLSASRPRESGDPYAASSRSAATSGARLCGRARACSHHVESPSASWPGLSRPPTPYFVARKTWVPGTRPGMTIERLCVNPTGINSSVSTARAAALAGTTRKGGR